MEAMAEHEVTSMKNALRRLWLTGLVALPLAACNQTVATDTLTTGSISVPANVRISSSNFQAPGGTGCRGEINRYKVVANNDQAMGQVGQSVFDQINREINEAELACQAGRDVEAVRMVNASKARHGYL